MTSVVADIAIVSEQGTAAVEAPLRHARIPLRRVWFGAGTMHSRWMLGTDQPVVGVIGIETLGAATTIDDSTLPIEFGEEQQGPPIPVEWGAGWRCEVGAPTEGLAGAGGDAEAMHEIIASHRRDMAVPAEGSPGVGVSLDAAILAESAAAQRSDRYAQIEASGIVGADPGIHAETTTRPVADLRLTGENGLGLLLGGNLPGETGLRVQFEHGTALAALTAALSHAVIETENLGQAVAVVDRPVMVESIATLSRGNRMVADIVVALMGFAFFAAENMAEARSILEGSTETAGSPGAGAAAGFEATAATRYDTFGLVEALLDLVAQFDAAKEVQLAQRADWPAFIEAELLARGAELRIEHLGSVAENRLSVEWAARFLADRQLLSEWAACFGNDALVSITEWVIAAHGPPGQPVTERGPAIIEWTAPPRAPLLQLGEGRRLATPGRVRLLKGPSGMRLPTAFDPINSGETDNFAFDFTGDIGAATMVSTSWTCALSPYQTAVDSPPRLRVLSTSLQTRIQIRDPLTGVLTTRAGNFSVASIGAMPPASIATTYILTAFITLTDGRTLSLSSTVQCTAP